MTTAADWWATSICRMEPGVVELRGVPVQDLIGSASFVSTIWLMVRGTFPDPREAALLEAALVASVDHGPQAPSIAIARMTATCGVGLNNAMASGVNALGDHHGGAGQQCVEILSDIVASPADSIDAATEEVISRYRETNPYVPGFGHGFHPVDPRRDPLLELVDRAVGGDHKRNAEQGSDPTFRPADLPGGVTGHRFERRYSLTPMILPGSDGFLWPCAGSGRGLGRGRG